MKFKTAITIIQLSVFFTHFLLLLVAFCFVQNMSFEFFVLIIINIIYSIWNTQLVIKAEFVDEKIVFTNLYNKKFIFLLSDCERIYYSIYTDWIGYRFIALKFKKRTIRIFHKERFVKDMPSKIVIDNLDKFINADISGIDGVDS